MKKLVKLDINTEKIMENEELKTLRGGYSNCCYCYSRDPIPRNMGRMAATNQYECTENCGEMGWTGSWGSC